MGKLKKICLIFLVGVIQAMLPTSVFAACGSPAGDEGAVEFFGTEYKICNGVAWEAIDLSGASGSCSDARVRELQTGAKAPGFCDGATYKVPSCKTETVQTGNCSLSSEVQFNGDGGQFGWAVAIHGDVMAVGARADSSSKGAAYVYIKVSSGWILQQKFTGSDSVAGDNFGHSVAVSGETVVVGAYNHTATQSSQGAAYVFTRSGTTWSEQQKLVADSPAASDSFGGSVSIYQDTIAVGAPGKDGTYVNQGAAYVFTRSGTTWSQEQILVDDDPVGSSDMFGTDLAVYGNTLLVGESRFGTSSAHIFTRSGTTWTEQAEFTSGASDDYFGGSVDLDGNHAVIGAFNSNKAYYYYGSGASWTLKKVLTPEDAVAGEFGRSVDYLNGFILVGAPAHTSNTGAAYLFQGSDVNWAQKKMFQASDAANNNYFGFAVAMADGAAAIGAYGKSSSQGYVYMKPLSFQTQYIQPGVVGDQVSRVAIHNGTMVIGAPFHDHSSLNNPGAAWVYTKDANGVWNFQAKLVASDAAADDNFGVAVDIHGDRIIVGARRKGSYAGKAYVFTRTGTNWDAGVGVTASDATTNSSYGGAVSIYNDTIAVGAWQRTTEIGKVYIYKLNGSSWDEQQTYSGGAFNYNARFGWTLSLYEDTLVVGEPWRHNTGTGGYIRIYNRSGSTWSGPTTLRAPTPANFDGYGFSVDIYSGTIAVGTGYYTNEKVYVYTGSGASWNLQATLTSPVAGTSYYGNWVSLYGDKLAVSAYEETHTTNYRGAAYLYSRSGSTWSVNAKYTPPVPADYDWFGTTVALDGEHAVVGQEGGSEGAYVFTATGALQSCDGSPVNQEVCGSYGGCYGVGAIDYANSNGMRWCDGSVWRQFKMVAATLGNFNISGVEGGTDSTIDDALSDATANPTFHWEASSNAANYDLVIKNDAESATLCSSLAVTSTSASPTGCGLVDGTFYKAFVTARSGGGATLSALNEPFRFLVGTLTLGSFNITGITGGSDTTEDNILDSGTAATVNWATSTNATSYDVVIKDSSGTTTLCSALGVTGNSVAPAGCGLVESGQYKAYVTAKGPGVTLPASNDVYDFTVYKVYVVNVTTTGSGSWQVPATGVTSLTVEAIGGGGGGGGNASGQGSGGSGGGYARSTISVTGNQVIYYTVGTGGAANSAGGDSWVNKAANSAPTVATDGARGARGLGGSAGGGATGALGCMGEVEYPGGNGAAAQNGGGNRGGSGGGGAGSGLDRGDGGLSGSGTSPGSGGNAGPNGGLWLPGGDGATGASSTVAALPASIPGGGGGGSASSTNGPSTGGRGQIRITYKGP